MKLLFISRALPVHRLGGLEHHLRDLALGLVARGHKIDILTTLGGTAAPLEEGIGLYEIPGSRPGDYSVGFFRRAEGCVADLHRRNAYDMVIPVDLAGLFIDPARFAVPVVPLIHGTLTTEVPLHKRFWAHLACMGKLCAVWRYKARLPLLWPFQRMVDRADAVVVDSGFTRRELLDIRDGAVRAERRSKIRIVPLGIDLTRYPGVGAAAEKRRRNGAQFRICLLGRLQKIKGVEIALRAAAQLKLRGVLFTMAIGGIGDFATQARAFIARHGLEDVVKLQGRIPPEELAEFLWDHDVFLFPDLTQPAFGLVAVEAMAHGLPVVAARSGAIPEVVRAECGWLYDPWDVGELAALLASLAADREQIYWKAARAQECAEEFTAEKMAARMDSALAEIARAGKKSGGADEARTRDLRRDRPAF